jgi:hypothetical protein
MVPGWHWHQSYTADQSTEFIGFAERYPSPWLKPGASRAVLVNEKKESCDGIK